MSSTLPTSKKLLREPFKTFSLYQATQIESELQNRSQTNFRMQALFQETKSLHPSPPSSFDRDFGRTKVAVQKFVIPAMTVFKRSRRPSKERDLALQELILLLTWSINGAQLAMDNFLAEEKKKVFWRLTARP